MMNWILMPTLAVATLVSCLSTCGCGGDGGGGTCGRFCEVRMFQTNDCLDEDWDCEIETDEYAGYVEECIEECNQAMADLTEEEQAEWSACVQCVVDDVGPEPDCWDIEHSILDDCNDECEEDGVDEFFDEFDEPHIDQNDVDC